MSIEKSEIIEIDMRDEYISVIKEKWTNILGLIFIIILWGLNFFLQTISVYELLMQIFTTILILFYIIQIIVLETKLNVSAYSIRKQIALLEEKKDEEKKD